MRAIFSTWLSCTAFVIAATLASAFDAGLWRVTSGQKAITRYCRATPKTRSLQRTRLWGANDEAADNSSDKNEKVKIDIIKKLDDTFEYEGRMDLSSWKDIQAKSLDEFRFGYVSIVGAPNMGKSTLMNALLREDLCVATRRPQTTRHAILGVMTQDDVQLAFTDTPGVIDNPAYKLQEGMMEAVKGALKDADIILVVTDIFSTPIPDDVMFQKIQAVCDDEDKPVIVAINKCDLLGKISKAKATGLSPEKNENESSADGKVEIPTTEELEEKLDDKTYSISDAVTKWRSLLPKASVIIPLIAGAKDDPGVNLLRDLVCGGPDVPASIRSLGRPIDGMFQEGVKFISNEEAQALVPKGPPMYDEDTLTDRTERFFASEMIRAAIFEEFKKEVPYCTEVQVSEFKEDPKKKLIRMRATIYVERESQKGIVVGKGGQQIKKVGVRSRKSLEDFFQSKIFLELSVKVDKDWRRKEDSLKKFGYMR